MARYWTGYFGNTCYYPENRPNPRAMRRAAKARAISLSGYEAVGRVNDGIGITRTAGAPRITSAGVFGGGVAAIPGMVPRVPSSIGINVAGGGGAPRPQTGLLPVVSPKPRIVIGGRIKGASFNRPKVATSVRSPAIGPVLSFGRPATSVVNTVFIPRTPPPVTVIGPGPGPAPEPAPPIAPAVAPTVTPSTSYGGGGGGGGGSPFPDAEATEELPTVEEKKMPWLLIAGGAAAAYFLFLKK